MTSDPDKMLEAAAAAKAGVGPAEVELPGNIVRAIVLFETEDGSFGAQPMTPGLTLDMAASLAERHLRRTQIQMATQALITAIKAQEKQIQPVTGFPATMLDKLKGK